MQEMKIENLIKFSFYIFSTHVIGPITCTPKICRTRSQVGGLRGGDTFSLTLVARNILSRKSFFACKG